MVFSSPAFLFIFFPLFYGLYFLAPKSLRNGLVLVASFAFYALGAGALTLVALLLLLLNWVVAGVIARLLESDNKASLARIVFVVSIVANLAPLVFFKYLMFFAQMVSDVTGLPAQAVVGGWEIALPLGISFYTFTLFLI